MMEKWLGAALILSGCTAWGISLAAGHKRREIQLRKLLQALDFMDQELRYRLTPLPELCRMAGDQAGGNLRSLFRALSQELDRQVYPDVSSCMAAALEKTGPLPELLRPLLVRLGQILGRFDLPGQLQGLDGVRQECLGALAALSQDRDNRLRSYRTLGICAGIALVVLLA